MKHEQEPRLSPKMRDAVTELQVLVRGTYPDASFHVRRSPEDTRSVHILTIVDVDDPDAVMDLVVDRVMQLQIEQKLPVHVVPLRTPEQTAKVIEDQRHRPHSAAHVSVDIVSRHA